MANLGAFTTTTGGNNGNFTLTDAEALNLTGSVNAGTGAVTLTSAGTITEQSDGTITAGTLTGSSAGSASFAQTGNLVTNLGAFATTAGGNNGNFTLTDAEALNITGLLNAGTGTVTLNSAGMITEQPGGSIVAGILIGSSMGGANLTQGNRVGTLDQFNNMTSGLLSFTDAQPFTTGVVSSAGDLTLTTTGASSNLTLAGNLSAPDHMVTLSSAGTLTEQTGVAITAGTLTGSSAGNASFAQPGNLVANLGAFATTTGGSNGDFSLTDGQALNIIGLLKTGTGTAMLNSAGSITEPAGGLITAGTLSGSSVGGASLTQANQVVNFGPFNNTTGGLLSFTDAQPLTTAGGISSPGGVTLTTTGTGSNLTLGANVTAPGQAVTLTSAGNITEVNDPVITASDLTVGATGKVSLGIDGDTVFPGNANMVGTLTGTAGGSFGFLNATALTVGTIAGSGGDVLIQVNNGQPLTLAGNITVTAGGRVILDTAGGFSQVGTATVNAPVLAIDTMGAGVNTLLGFITSPSVNASAIFALPPTGKTSNPIQFGNLSAPNSVVLLFADQGSVAGSIQAGQLGLSGTGSFANLQGSINGVSGPMAALLGVRAPRPEPSYLFNDCILAALTCVVIPAGQPVAFLVTQPQTAGEIQALSVSPNLSAQFVLIEPEIVKGVRQSEDPDAPVINIFDEERLCDETAKSQPNKEPCREER